MIVNFIFNIFLVTLLVATIVYCARLSRRIKTLQDSRSEFASMITQFDGATSRATAAVAELQNISKRITEALQLKIDKANFLADDLAFLIEKSNKMVVQIEQAKMSLKKPESQPVVVPPTVRPSLVSQKPSLENVLQALSASAPEASPPPAEEKTVPRTRAERELLSALKSRAS